MQAPPQTRRVYDRARIASHTDLTHLEVTPWQTDIEQQVHHFNQQVHGALRKGCAPGIEKAKKTYITEEIWQLRGSKLASRKALKLAQRTLNQGLLKQIFTAWKHGRDTSEDTLRVVQRCHQMRLYAQFTASDRALRQRLRRSKLSSLREAFEQMPDKASASSVLQIVKEHWGPTNPKKIKQRPLPIINQADGQPCRTPDEVLNRWVTFFCEMEGGQRMTTDAQRQQWISNLSELRETSFHLDFGCLPSLVDLEVAYRRVANGKATGPDDIPSETCCYHAANMARATYAQLMKLLLHGQEDLAHKGGKLVKAWKGKGPQNQCSSYRSLLISSHPGKVLHRTLRLHQSTLFETFLQSQQLGGRRGVPVQLGLHLARSFQRWQQTSGNSHAFVFLDLQEAFYRLLRPLALDTSMTDAQVAEVVARLGLSPDTMHEIMENLQKPTAIQAANLHWTQRKAATAIHRDTHFWMDHQADRCVTHVGSRPGDSFADLIFSYAWSKVLNLYEERLRAHDVLTYVPHHTTWSPFTSDLDLAGDDCVPFLGPCWMDDLAICLTAESSLALERKTALAGSLLMDLCEAHGMTPNLKAGKTEAMMIFKGARSKAMRSRYYKPGENARLPLVCEEGTRHLHVTGTYLHLGNVLHHSGKSAMELRRRVAIAQQAFNQHRRLLYHNGSLTWDRRRELFDTLILSKLLYGAETWVLTDWRTKEYFHSAIMRLYKRLLQVPHDSALTDEEILAQGNFISPSTLLRRQRLRYLGVLHACASVAHWGLLTQDQGWNQLIQWDLDWMYQQLHHASDLPDPRTGFAHWQYLMTDHRKFWKRLINRAVRHEVRQGVRLAEITRFHAEFLALLAQAGPLSAQAPSTRRAQRVERYGCMICQVACKSKAGEGVHMCKAHGIVATHRHLFEGTQCPVCLREFFTHSKLSNHIRDVRGCREELQARRPAC